MLTRPRDANDYLKLAKAQGHRGATDPSLFTAHLRAAADQLTMDEVRPEARRETGAFAGDAALRVCMNVAAPPYYYY